MPYNNTPIAPPQEWNGTVSLPLARVKKIINADDDISQCSNNAAFVIAVATEMFVQHLVEQAHNVVKSERRPRRNIQYKDVANAVSRIDNLEFLSDVVPPTISYKAYKQKKAKEVANDEQPLTNGQTTLDQIPKHDEDRIDVEMEDKDGPSHLSEQEPVSFQVNGTHPYENVLELRSPKTARSPDAVRGDTGVLRNGYDMALDPSSHVQN